MVYDFTKKQYVGVFSKYFLRLWDSDTEDINKVKRVKLNKSVHELLSVKINGKRRTLVVYDDGKCESIETALENNVGSKKSAMKTTSSKLESVQMTNKILSYVNEVNNEKIFCYTSVDEETLSSAEVKSFKLDRYGQNVKLMAFTVIPGKNVLSDPALLTMWSDNRLFKQPLSSTDQSPSIGSLHSIIDCINSAKRLSIVPISEDSVAFYASKAGDDGSFIIMYNTKFKIVQSKVPFKVYFPIFKLWTVRRNLFLAMAEQLSVVPFRVSANQLSSMVGSQCDVMTEATVEKEMINEDLSFEENLEFDDDQSSVEDMQMTIQYDREFRKKPMLLSGATPVAGAEEVTEKLNEIYREDLSIDIFRTELHPETSLQVKLLSNIDESFPFLSDNFELLCNELEKYGCSEIEITGRVIPILIKTNRTEEIGLLLKRYNHVSEQRLVDVVKYLLACPTEKQEEMETAEANQIDDKAKSRLKGKKVVKPSVLLSTRQRINRDVLSIALCSSFDSHAILKFLRKEIKMPEMITLMDHLYATLSTSSFDEQYDMRGNLVEGSDFDLDSKLFEWFKVLLDTHYQQILLCHNADLHEKLNQWLQLVDDHIRILSEMSSLRPLLAKLATNKLISPAKKYNQWYSIEKLKLY